MPFATFNEEAKKQDEEYVAAIEGVVYPFFGLAYSVDKVMYNIDEKIDQRIDVSPMALKHAQKLANLFVDEARLSTNFFKFRDDESKDLISNVDTHLVEVVDEIGEKTLLELYLFEWKHF